MLPYSEDEMKKSGVMEFTDGWLIFWGCEVRENSEMAEIERGKSSLHAFFMLIQTTEEGLWYVRSQN